MLLFVAYNSLIAQNSQSLIQIHNVATVSAMNNISSPFTGNVVYVIENETIYHYNGSQWVQLADANSGSSSSWDLLGNSGTNSSVNFLGTTDNNDFNIRTNNTNRVRVEANGNFRVLNDLVVDGAAYSNTSLNAGSATTINFQQSNLAYTNANAQNTFTLQNLKDGGTYTLSVRGTSAGTASFSAAGYSFKSTSNGKTIANTHTLYTFLVIGNIVYVNMCTGL